MTSSDASDIDAKKLEKKLKSYEGKLATLTAINSALQNENDDLRQRLASQPPQNSSAAEIEELTEEFARRLGASERQVQQIQDERDELKSQLRLLSQDGNAVASKLQDKEEYIKALQVEGEKLSRKNGELETIARKVRAQLREAEGEKEKLAAQMSKAESKVNKLTEKLKQQQEESTAKIAAAKEEAEQIRQEAANAVANAQQSASTTVQETQQQTARETAEALAAAESREASLLASLAELRSNMEDEALAAAEREAALRAETSELEQRVRELETVNHALQNNTSEATGPLLRQIESMAAAASVQQHAAREAEHRLHQKLAEVEKQLALLMEQERQASARAHAAENALSSSREAANSAVAASADLKSQLERERDRCQSLQAELEEFQRRVEQIESTLTKKLALKDADIQQVREQLYESEERYRTSAQQHDELQGRLRALEEKLEANTTNRRKTTPSTDTEQILDNTTSPDKAKPGSISSSKSERDNQVIDIAPPQHADIDGVDMDELFKSVGASSSSSGGGATLRYLQGGIHSDSGRIRSLEQRLQLAEAARDAANEQLMSAMERAGAAEASASRINEVKLQLEEAQSKLIVALECLGEKNERIDQLEEDIQEMKQIFHDQLNLAMTQMEALRLQIDNTSGK